MVRPVRRVRTVLHWLAPAAVWCGPIVAAVWLHNGQSGNDDSVGCVYTLEVTPAPSLSGRFAALAGESGQVVGTVAHILEGEILWAEDDLSGAIAAFEKAVEVEDSMAYDEPEPLPFAARHWLGAALMEAGRQAAAEQEYQVERVDSPQDVWSR